ncbi:hypothetical protein CDAR_62881 [Caerostris darwini]|uniref:Uncharacterized protein n=1 Tax=Caerostris darwini TaxID=1538125 RepID=A0AAV4UFB4_9ARAC|nr:hypothetical protein CDAR_62881 [Caerostris darwini]
MSLSVGLKRRSRYTVAICIWMCRKSVHGQVAGHPCCLTCETDNGGQFLSINNGRLPFIVPARHWDDVTGRVKTHHSFKLIAADLVLLSELQPREIVLSAC